MNEAQTAAGSGEQMLGNILGKGQGIASFNLNAVNVGEGLQGGGGGTSTPGSSAGKGGSLLDSLGGGLGKLWEKAKEKIRAKKSIPSEVGTHVKGRPLSEAERKLAHDMKKLPESKGKSDRVLEARAKRMLRQAGHPDSQVHLSEAGHAAKAKSPFVPKMDSGGTAIGDKLKAGSAHWNNHKLVKEAVKSAGQNAATSSAQKAAVMGSAAVTKGSASMAGKVVASSLKRGAWVAGTVLCLNNAVDRYKKGDYVGMALDTVVGLSSLSIVGGLAGGAALGAWDSYRALPDDQKPEWVKALSNAQDAINTAVAPVVEGTVQAVGYVGDKALNVLGQERKEAVIDYSTRGLKAVGKACDTVNEYVSEAIDMVSSNKHVQAAGSYAYEKGASALRSIGNFLAPPSQVAQQPLRPATGMAM